MKISEMGPVAEASAAAESSSKIEWEVPEATAAESGFTLNLEWLKTPTGDGDIESYLNHPLNFPKSKGLAQMLRGATGLAGHDLKLAIIDLVLGGLNFVKERGANAAAHTVSR